MIMIISGEYMSTFSTPRGKRQVQSKAVAVTAPAHVVNKLLRPLVPEVGGRPGCRMTDETAGRGKHVTQGTEHHPAQPSIHTAMACD